MASLNPKLPDEKHPIDNGCVKHGAFWPIDRRVNRLLATFRYQRAVINSSSTK